jgi:hypothetical protein
MGSLVDPTEEQRRLVRAMSGFGIPQEQIATHLEVDAKTLRKHFRQELDRGMVEANLKVAQSLFQMATAGKNVAAAIFWMKARANWREKQAVEVAGPDGQPLAAPTVVLIRKFFAPPDDEPPKVVDARLLPDPDDEPEC